MGWIKGAWCAGWSWACAYAILIQKNKQGLSLDKSKAEIISYSEYIVKYFIENDVKAIVIACGTASDLAFETLKNYYDVPIFNVIDSTVNHLNSNNIKNAYCRELYNPTDESHITNVYCFDMVMSINYFRDMVDKFGNIRDAFYAYNGGQKAPKIINSNIIPKSKERFVKNVKAYANSVST